VPAFGWGVPAYGWRRHWHWQGLVLVCLWFGLFCLCFVFCVLFLFYQVLCCVLMLSSVLLSVCYQENPTCWFHCVICREKLSHSSRAMTGGRSGVFSSEQSEVLLFVQLSCVLVGLNVCVSLGCRAGYCQQHAARRYWAGTLWISHFS
jgi:hypothetical protein